MSKAGAIIAGRYRVVRPLARGGMGQIWEGRHEELEAPIAIKLMDARLGADGEARARFKREAKAIAALRSPHVVQVLDYGVDRGAPFIVMELLEGEDLRSRMQRAGAMELVTAVKIIRQASKALMLAADAGIVHRDLKPANLFLARSGGEEIVKVLDFGIAQSGALETAVPMGSPHFMSPEQARGLPVGAASDLWSLGVIFFALLTGRKPFEGPELGDLILQICEEPLPVPSRVHPALAAAVDVFFTRALCRDPKKRFESAAAFGEAALRLAEETTGIRRAELESPLRVDVERPDAASISPSDDAAVTLAPAPGHDTLTVATTSTPLHRARARGRLWLLGGAAALVAAWLVLGTGSLGGGRESSARAPASPLVRHEAPARRPVLSTPAAAAASTAVPRVPTASSSARVRALPPPGDQRHKVLGY